MRILSLGWGVQSFTLAAMVALGELEQIDYAIHADTTHESKLTYEFVGRWTEWLEGKGLKIVTVKSSDTGPIDKYKGVMIPVFIGNETKGKFTRQCTTNWKVMAIRRWLQENRKKQPIEQWLGISLDEFQRMKESDVKYITNRWPLIEKRMTRNDCMNWLKRHGLEIPVKSACTFCPFRTDKEWRNIKDTPEDWQEATMVDEQIRKGRAPHDLFVHRSLLPLENVDFRTEQEKGQMSLWDEECSGMCGV